MDITHLSIANFLTIGQAVIELDGRGLILIQGENQDDTSAASNGAGKSSIVDALCWCLYGVTARDVTGDDVVNDTAKKDCSVFVELDDGGVKYKIERFRKHKTMKNQLFAWQIDPTGGPSTDLSKGTDKETQEVVKKIMGCSLDVFVGAIYAGQEKTPDLPGMTDKQLKLLIEEAAGVEELAEAYKEASARALAVERGRTVAVTTLKTTQDRHAALMGELVILNADMDIFEGTRKDKAKVELAKIKPLQDAIDMNQGRITAFDEPTLIANQTRLEASLAAHDAEKAALKVLVDAETIASMSVVAARSAASTLKGIYDKRVTALADIDSQVGKPCGECGKAYCEHDLEGAKVARQTQIDAAKTDLMKAATDLKAKIPLHEDATKTAATYRASMTDVSVAVAEMGTIRGWLREVTSLRSGIASLTSDIERLKAAAKRHLTDPNPWTKAVEGKQAEIDKIEIEIATLTFECLALEDKAEVYANAVKVFGPAGVRAHILDTVTPFLNEKTSEYLGALSDGNIHATWSTLTKTAKGELKEKFNIEVTNDKGGKTFKAISGGEKRKVRLAAALALQDMVATRASKPINLFLADEIDDALDEPGMERLMGVLEKKAKERGTVLVISHRSLTDWIDVVINVTKSGGVSTVTGATVRGF